MLEFLLSVGSETVQQLEGTNKIAEERPEILPWFLGFLAAMFLLNVVISKVRNRKSKDRQ